MQGSKIRATLMKPFHSGQFLLLLSLLSTGAWADTQVNVVGLFNGKAVLIINNGKPQTLAAGQSSTEGVKLIAADSGKAVLLVEGKRRELGMGQAAIVAGGSSSQPGSVTLYADAAGHYITEGQVNGVGLKFLVDTGSTAIAMNSDDALRAGIDYKKGERIGTQTANGTVNAYHVVINTLKLGDVLMNQVDGIVIEGNAPSLVLLGMSALNRMDMKREGIALTLTKKY